MNLFLVANDVLWLGIETPWQRKLIAGMCVGGERKSLAIIHV